MRLSLIDHAVRSNLGPTTSITVLLNWWLVLERKRRLGAVFGGICIGDSDLPHKRII